MPTHFCPPVGLPLRHAVVVGPRVVDDGLRDAEEEGEEPRQGKHHVALVDRPLVVGQGEADGLE